VATIRKRGKRWQVMVRKGGHVRSTTLETHAQAKSWADSIEDDIADMKASGVMSAKGETIATLVDRYRREMFAVRPWGRSKDADLLRIKKDLGGIAVSALTAHHITAHFRKRFEEGAGRVVLSSQIGYLVGVLETARTLWHLNVPLQAAKDARTALAKIRLVGKAQQRDRRVSDAEIAKLVALFNTWGTSSIPMADLTRFALASGMRVSEVCRLRWDDLNETDKTVLIRDRKHPSEKLGNNMRVPLLDATATGLDAFKIVKAQPRVDGEPRIFPFNSRSVSCYFTEAVTKLKLGDLHLHDLRHEAISRLFAAGYGIQEVALVSGHRDWHMLRRYTHVKAADLHRTKPAPPKPAPNKTRLRVIK